MLIVHLANSFGKDMKKQRRCHVIPMWKFVHDFDHHARWGPKRMIAEKLNASENVLGFWQWGLRLAHHSMVG